jgi:Transcriptional regulator PadR-like family
MKHLRSAAQSIFPVDMPQVFRNTPVVTPQEPTLSGDKSEILRGTLDLKILKTLEVIGPSDGYGIARRIEQSSEEGLPINRGTIYASLVRLTQKLWISRAAHRVTGITQCLLG